jgi:lipopolysaccharide/colanic/teichoic acid biosynthesis glycosyltransferase
MPPQPEIPGRRSAGLYARGGKRLLDLVLTVPALLVLAPVLLLVALLVRLALGAPVLFRQQRPGRGGRPFANLKFRSMTQAVGADGQLLPDAQRLNGFGRLLRASSLDELPQLLNVLRGDMSLVGPRPLLMRYLELYTPHQARRHEVRPGITGWAQINGRNFIAISKRVEMDVWYVDHLGLWLDLKILLLTVPRVLSSRSVVVAEARETMDLGGWRDPPAAGPEPGRRPDPPREAGARAGTGAGPGDR